MLALTLAIYLHHAAKVSWLCDADLKVSLLYDADPELRLVGGRGAQQTAIVSSGKAVVHDHLEGTINIKHQTSNIKYHAFNIKYQTSNIKYQTSNIKCQISNINYQTSNVWEDQGAGSRCPQSRTPRQLALAQLRQHCCVLQPSKH